MTFFLNPFIGLRHPKEARSAVSKDAYWVMQTLFRTLRQIFHYRLSLEDYAKLLGFSRSLY